MVYLYSLNERLMTRATVEVVALYDFLNYRSKLEGTGLNDSRMRRFLHARAINENDRDLKIVRCERDCEVQYTITGMEYQGK